MINFNFLSVLAFFTVALADRTVRLVSESDDQALSGLNVSSFYAAPAFNFLYLGSNDQPFRYSESDGKIYILNNVTGTKSNLTVLPYADSEIAVSAIGGAPLSVDHGYVSINGSTTLYAAKNTTYDPDHYALDAYQLLATPQNGSSSVRVRVENTDEVKETVLITGAGSGFGKNASFILASQGYNVIATVETIHEIHQLRWEAGLADLPITVKKLDITDEGDRQRAATWDVDILVNNAGIGEGGAVIDIPENRLRRQFEVNVFGSILLTQKIARNLIEKRSGKIVFVSSVAGLTTDPFAGAYSSSKHALEAFCSALDQELWEFGVTIQTVNPGPILTGYNDRIFETYEEWLPEDLENAVFDYSKLAFPHKQYDPRQVSDLLAAVVNGSVTTYRNIVPSSIYDQQKGMVDDMFTREAHNTTEMAPLIQTAYQMYPGTPVEA